MRIVDETETKVFDIVVIGAVATDNPDRPQPSGGTPKHFEALRKLGFGLSIGGGVESLFR